jgi:hypothetical protein
MRERERERGDWKRKKGYLKWLHPIIYYWILIFIIFIHKEEEGGRQFTMAWS